MEFSLIIKREIYIKKIGSNLEDVLNYSIPLIHPFSLTNVTLAVVDYNFIHTD